MIQVMTGRHQRDASGQHRFDGGAPPRFPELMAERIDKQIQAVQESYLALFLGWKQVPTVIKMMPPYLRAKASSQAITRKRTSGKSKAS